MLRYRLHSVMMSGCAKHFFESVGILHFPFPYTRILSARATSAGGGNSSISFDAAGGDFAGFSGGAAAGGSNGRFSDVTLPLPCECGFNSWGVGSPKRF